MQSSQHGPRAEGRRVRVEEVSVGVSISMPNSSLPCVHRLGDRVGHDAVWTQGALRGGFSRGLQLDAELESSLCPSTRGPSRPRCKVASTVPVLRVAGCASRRFRSGSASRRRTRVFPVSIDSGTESATLQSGRGVRFEKISVGVCISMPNSSLPCVHRLGDRVGHFAVWTRRALRGGFGRGLHLDAELESSLCPSTRGPSRPLCSLDAACASRRFRSGSASRCRAGVFPVSIDSGTESATLQSGRRVRVEAVSIPTSTSIPSDPRAS